MNIGNSHLMKIFVVLLFVFCAGIQFAAPGVSASTPSDTVVTYEASPVGFASVNALGQNGTTGGAGGDTVYITTGDALYTFLDDRKDPNGTLHLAPKVVVIQGKITSAKKQLEIKQTYNLTFIGKGTDAAFEGTGLFVKQSYNIIIRNLEFRNSPIDGIAVQYAESHHVWIDHCTLSDSPDLDTADARHDGLIDVTHGASYVTISWCHLTNHTKTCLLGHSDDNSAEDAGKLKTTYHHNWFDNSGQRHPRVRYAECHIFNNYYVGNGRMLYGVASTCTAQVTVESNYFKSVPSPTLVGYAESPVGNLVERNNIYVNSGVPQTLGTVPEPGASYQYTLTDPALLPVIIPKYCGSGHMPVITAVNAAEKQRPEQFKLEQNFPNPFNPTTGITYSLAADAKVTIKVFDIMGKEVALLVDREESAGQHVINFNAASLASGIYYYSLKAGNFLQTRKLVLVK